MEEMEERRVYGMERIKDEAIDEGRRVKGHIVSALTHDFWKLGLCGIDPMEKM
jgi:hypothetical protein